MSKEQWGHGYHQAMDDARPAQIADGVKQWLVRNEGLGEIEDTFKSGVADGVYRWMEDHKADVLRALSMGEGIWKGVEREAANPNAPHEWPSERAKPAGEGPPRCGG